MSLLATLKISKRNYNSDQALKEGGDCVVLATTMHNMLKS